MARYRKLIIEALREREWIVNKSKLFPELWDWWRYEEWSITDKNLGREFFLTFGIPYSEGAHDKKKEVQEISITDRQPTKRDDLNDALSLSIQRRDFPEKLPQFLDQFSNGEINDKE